MVSFDSDYSGGDDASHSFFRSVCHPPLPFAVSFVRKLERTLFVRILLILRGLGPVVSVQVSPSLLEETWDRWCLWMRITVRSMYVYLGLEATRNGKYLGVSLCRRDGRYEVYILGTCPLCRIHLGY